MDCSAAAREVEESKSFRPMPHLGPYKKSLLAPHYPAGRTLSQVIGRLQKTLWMAVDLRDGNGWQVRDLRRGTRCDMREGLQPVPVKQWPEMLD